MTAGVSEPSVLPESPAEARVSAAHQLDAREIVRQPIQQRLPIRATLDIVFCRPCLLPMEAMPTRSLGWGRPGLSRPRIAGHWVHESIIDSLNIRYCQYFGCATMQAVIHGFIKLRPRLQAEDGLPKMVRVDTTGRQSLGPITVNLESGPHRDHVLVSHLQQCCCWSSSC
jgi:hypothetical protein